MRKEIADRWVEALRSGRYKQGKMQLRCTASNTYCCLGVLCDLAENSGVGKWVSDRYGVMELFRTDEYSRSSLDLPKDIVEWAEIKSGASVTVRSDPAFLTDDQKRRIQTFTTLAEMNDGGFDFEQIAQAIEKHWKHL